MQIVGEAVSLSGPIQSVLFLVNRHVETCSAVHTSGSTRRCAVRLQCNVLSATWAVGYGLR